MTHQSLKENIWEWMSWEVEGKVWANVYFCIPTQHNTDRELQYTIGWLTTKKVEIQHPLHRALLVIVEQGLCCAREQLPRRHCVRPRRWPQISVPYHTISHETSTKSLHCLLNSATPLLLFPCPPPVTCVESSCSKATFTRRIGSTKCPHPTQILWCTTPSTPWSLSQDPSESDP